MDINLEKLNDGLKLLTVDMASSPSATIMVIFKVGSRFEDSHNSGVAHLIEHTMFKGTNKRPNSKVIANEVESMGGYMNAATSYEFTEYYIKVPTENIEKAIEILSDMIMNSKFDEEEITKEKGVVVEEIKMYEDNPNRAINELLYSHLWKDQPLGRNIAGSIPSVKDLSSVDIRNFINKYYYASNAMFVVSGDLSGVNVKELVESNFKLPMRTDLAVFDKARINEERTLIVNRPVEQSHICLATYGLESNNPLNYNLRIANSVLGLGAGSYLYQEIREKLGAAYYVYSWTDNYSDTGIFCMQAGLDNSKVSEGMDSMISSFNAIKNQKVLTEDLKRAKEIYKGYLSMELESSEDMGRWIAHQYIENGEFNTLDEVKKIVQAITAEDIERVMSETIFKDLHLVMLTSLEDNDKLISTIYQ